jgi:hypothetical protein
VSEDPAIVLAERAETEGITQKDVITRALATVGLPVDPLDLQDCTSRRRWASPLLQAAKLWQRTFARGTTYMSGQLGGVRVVIMPNHANADAPGRETRASAPPGAPRLPDRRRPGAILSEAAA